MMLGEETPVWVNLGQTMSTPRRLPGARDVFCPSGIFQSSCPPDSGAFMSPEGELFGVDRLDEQGTPTALPGARFSEHDDNIFGLNQGPRVVPTDWRFSGMGQGPRIEPADWQFEGLGQELVREGFRYPDQAPRIVPESFQFSDVGQERVPDDWQMGQQRIPDTEWFSGMGAHNGGVSPGNIWALVLGAAGVGGSFLLKNDLQGIVRGLGLVVGGVSLAGIISDLVHK